MSAHAGEERLGPYCLREQLGEGGMGVVYLATDPAERPVAIKVLRHGVAAEETARRRLAHEVETMRRVSSPYVAEVVDADISGNPPYIVTRFVPGKTLEDVVAAEGPVTGAGLASLASGLTAALTAVHAAGIVHRDLKPGNVMLLDGQPVVIDFGIAQAADSTRLTMTGMFMGTPGYLAPEVIEGKPSGPAADVHSWGATMAYAATGRPPFGTGTFEAIFYRIVHGQPDLSGMPTALVPLVLTALARDPSRRPTAAELTESLARLEPAELVAPPAGQVVPNPAGWPATRTSPGLPWSQVPSTSVEPAIGPRSAAAQPQSAGAAAASAAGGGVAGGAMGGPAVAGPAVAGAAAGAAAMDAAQLAPGAGQQFAAAPLTSSPAAWPGTQPLAVRSRDDFADLLPPVDYRGRAGQLAPAQYQAPPFSPGSAAGSPTGAWPGAGAGPRPGAAFGPAGTRPPSRTPLVLATMAGLIALSVLLPVAGTAAVLLALVLLRSADLVTARRARRSSSGAAAAAYFPWAVCRSLLRLVLLAPLALLCAGGAAAIAVLAAGSSDLPKAGGWAAGALVACYCLGPGSAGCRRPLSRWYGRMTRSTFGAVAGFAGLAAVAVVAVTAAAALTPGYWPASHLGQQLQTAPLSHPFLNHWPSSLIRAGDHLVRWLRRRL